MIINDAQDGYVIFLSQKELDRLIGWYRGWLDEHAPDQLDDDMHITLMTRARGNDGYDERKYNHNNNNNNNKPKDATKKNPKSVLHKVNEWLASRDDEEEEEEKE